MKRPWKEFAVGEPSDDPKCTEISCQPMTEVAHVAHVPTAVRILEDKRIRADLVYDESKLNSGRVRVVWLSPNDWTGAGGFRYGHVRFTFDFASLVRSKRYYWVECIRYRPTACRILITTKDHDDDLVAYDPTDGDGPWWQDEDGDHYRNGEYTLEFMFEGDLRTRKANEIDFVKHHPNRCSIDAATCRYKDVSESRAAAELIGRLASHGTPLKLPGFTGTSDEDRIIPSRSVSGGLTFLLVRSKRAWQRAGRLRAESPAAAAVARALLSALARAHADDAEELASLFRTADEAQEAVASVLADLLGLAEAEHVWEV